MSRLHVKYLLVGGGLASTAAAEAIRALDANGSILMLGQEPVRPYHRPPLSKTFLRRDTPRAELFARDADWFDSTHVELRTGRRVAHLDVARRTASVDNGDEITYDHLLLATGAAATAAGSMPVSCLAHARHWLSSVACCCAVWPFAG